ncbi:MAG: hypothetical protein FWF60_03805 [Oscillospiraceae bacterium]|nr:hypothetical protein [Oscillospiraceae bacterium]
MKKYFACLAAALLLFALAVPAFAEPDEAQTAAEGYVTENPDEAFDSEALDGEEETTAYVDMTVDCVVETVEDILPIDGVLLAEEGGGLLSQRNLTFAALGLAGLALLLSIAALARTRKKSAPNAAGNYQKYF